MITQLPELDELKVLLKETKNIAFYKRTEWTGPEESVEYLKMKIKEFDTLMDDSKAEKLVKKTKKSGGKSI